MNFKEFQEKYRNLIENNPKKTKLFTQWSHSDLDKNKNFLFSSEEEILLKLKGYMDTWNHNKLLSLKKLNKENSEILFKTELFDEALKGSFEMTKIIYKKLFNLNITEYSILDYINAQEYCMQNPYKMPSKFNRKKILDIGAGFGRSLAVPYKLVKDLIYCSIDVQKEQYFSQYLVYKCYENIKLFEYFEDTEKFKINDTPGIYHLPNLKMDLITDNYFDHVICTFVLGEIPIKLIKIFLKEINRVLKPRGSLFIRDHLNRFYKTRINLHDLLDENFFREFQPYLLDNDEIKGNHMIYRKKTTNYPFYNNKTSLLKKIIYKLVAKFY